MREVVLCFLDIESNMLRSSWLNSWAARLAPKSHTQRPPQVHVELFFRSDNDSNEGYCTSIVYNKKIHWFRKVFSTVVLPVALDGGQCLRQIKSLLPPARRLRLQQGRLFLLPRYSVPRQFQLHLRLSTALLLQRVHQRGALFRAAAAKHASRHSPAETLRNHCADQLDHDRQALRC